MNFQFGCILIFLFLFQVYTKNNQEKVPKDNLKPNIYQKYSNSSENEEQRIRKIIFSNVNPSSNPIAIFLGGGTGSGKKYLKPKLSDLGFIPKNFVTISSSDILIKLDDWGKFTNTTVCAANVLHERSSELADKFFLEAINNNYDILYDGTMSNIESTANRIQSFISTNFTVKMIGVFSNISIALERAIEDFIKTNRWVPYEIMTKSHIGYSNSFPFYASKIQLSYLYYFDEVNFQLIVSNSTIHDWEKFTKFMNIRNLDPSELFDSLNEKARTIYEYYDNSCLSRKIDLPFVYIGFAVIGSSFICAVFILVFTFSLLFTFWRNFRSKSEGEEEHLFKIQEKSYFEN